MLKFIDEILQQFQICFKRKETFLWFSVIVMGFMLRQNYRGVTSMVGALYLEPKFYETMIHFFRSKAVNLELVKYKWANIVMKNITPVKIHNSVVMIADHIKVSKEARKMPGVKKLYQDSENFGKAKYIFGHQHGMAGILAEGNTLQCIPVDIELHDGVEKIEKFKADLENRSNEKEIVAPTEKKKFEAKEIEIVEPTGKNKSKAKKKGILESTKKNKSKAKKGFNSIVRIMEMAKKFTKEQSISVIFLLDAYFSNATAFNSVYEANEANKQNQILLIARAKSNTVAYEVPNLNNANKHGRKRKYGDKIKLKELFSGNMEGKSTTKIKLYDKMELVNYMCLDLMWKPVKRLCRFVLVKTKEKTMILISSDLTIDPVDMILAYSYRFKIEVSFKTLKYSIRSFFYHFWTSAMPRLTRYKKEANLSEIDKDEDKKKIVETAKAIEVFTLLSSISMGLLTIISLKFEGDIWHNFKGWLRTKSSNVPSVETTRNVLHDEWLINLSSLEKYAVLSKIQKYQKRFWDLTEKRTA
jgi:hypothetical protein